MFTEIEKKINVENDPFDHAIIKDILPLTEIEKAEIEFKKFNHSMDSGSERYQKTKQHFEEFEKMPVFKIDRIRFCLFWRIFNKKEC